MGWMMKDISKYRVLWRYIQKAAKGWEVDKDIVNRRVVIRGCHSCQTLHLCKKY